MNLLIFNYLSIKKIHANLSLESPLKNVSYQPSGLRASADTGSETVLYKNISSNIVAQFHKTYNTKINNYNRKYNPFPY